ncbi:hypothetical protein LZG74_07270 [Dyadobacter sp. CY327]|nr:hypothetical protein [Dyadobacter sp. CY327]MCE7070093.1 hypothetical protein [Dyadobacter sp. CY327]
MINGIKLAVIEAKSGDLAVGEGVAQANYMRRNSALKQHMLRMEKRFTAFV